MLRRFLQPVGILVTVLIVGSAPADEQHALKEIMSGLRNSLVEIADGLLTDDFNRIIVGAAAIAEHPQIPASQVRLVAAELGSEMPTFKQLDLAVHDLSIEIGDAAKRSDRNAIISLYLQMTEGCLGCHETYKERVAAVLAEKRE